MKHTCEVNRMIEMSILKLIIIILLSVLLGMQIIKLL